MLVARAIVPELARIVEKLRAHHLRLEQLIAEACGGDHAAWEIQLGYRGDSIIVACSSDRAEELVIVAWTMVERSNDDPDDLRTCIGLSRETVVDVAAFRPDLPERWPLSTDLQGLAVERALSLVHDFGDPDQILLCDDLVHKIVPAELERKVSDAAERQLRLEPIKDKAQVLHEKLPFIPVAQLAWDRVEPGTLTNRHLLARELKDLQPEVTAIIDLFAQHRSPMLALYSSEEGATHLEQLDVFVSEVAPAKLKSLKAAWKKAPESQEQDELKRLLAKLDGDYETAVVAFRGLQTAISRHDDDSGARSEARGRLQGAWQECRQTPTLIMDCIESLLNELYS